MSGDDCDLYHVNEQCPTCGDDADPDIRAVETGLRYCSADCAGAHINRHRDPVRCDACGELIDVET